METVQITECPIGGGTGSIYFSEVKDAYFGTPGEWTYRKQLESGHLWLDPRPKESAIADLYVNYYTHTDTRSLFDPSLLEQAVAIALHRRLGYPLTRTVPLVSKLISYLPTLGASADMDVMKIPATRTGRMLDVGCGDGSFMRRMQAAGWTVVGIEPDVKAAARLAAQDGFPIYTTVEELVAGGEVAFDRVVLSHVIEHVIDPIANLMQLKSLLSTDGELLLTTPNAQSIGAIIFGAAWRGLEAPRHFNIFTCQSLEQTVRRAGFEVRHMSTESRMARGIWYLSYLARTGKRNLERDREPGHRILKMCGYVFQVLESALLLVMPRRGEEIYCCAVRRRNLI